VEIVLFNPMEAVGIPEAPVIIGPLEGTRGSLAPISPIFDP